MLKIHILGAPGSGKTTLASRLSSRLSIPHYDLDQLTRKNGDQRSAYKDDVFAIVSQSGWITEGIQLIWTDPLLYHADYIILVDISWPVAAWRILRRHVTKSFYGNNPYPGIKPLLKLLHFTHGYCVNKVSRMNYDVCITHTHAEEYVENMDVCAVNPLNEYFERYGKCIPPTAGFTRLYLEKYGEKVLFVKSDRDRDYLFEFLF